MPADSDCLETTSLADLMQILGNTDGCKASAIIGDKIGVLYSHAADPHNTRVLSNYYAQAKPLHSESESCPQLSVVNNDDLMVILSSEKNYLVRFHLVVLLSKQSDLTIMRIHLQNLLPEIMRSLTWDPDNFLPLFMGRGKYRLATTSAANTPPTL